MIKFFLKKLIFLAVLLSALSVGTAVHAFSGCEENCLNCHSLDGKEVKEILTKIKIPDAGILNIQISPVKGLWEVSIDNEGRKGLLYIGFDKKHIIRGPIVEIETLSKKTRENIGRKEKKDRYVDYARIPLDSALVMGSRDAEHKIAVFTDPDCAYCAQLHGDLKTVIQERKDIAFFIKLFPLRFHKDAYWKSKSIICNNSLKMLEDNFEKKPIPQPGCETAEIDNNIALAKELEISGTPTLILPNGLVVTGAKDAGTIIELVLNPPAKGEKQ
jgi:thiol:disulfide interchange protein DsbC